ncbi:hypothetical protein L6452_41792 [Arctium lappa]|uniref:Uncharacterized protein n=1 Tax=Arctium lappa TaxID=4217 RepID=A0ACB8XPZ6_ARCLA|nr:hypothetical protein L6452_41792 [Arctium lappa]
MVISYFSRCHIGDFYKRSKLHATTGNFGTVVTTKCFASDLDQLKSAREDIKDVLKATFCHTILVEVKVEVEA